VYITQQDAPHRDKILIEFGLPMNLVGLNKTSLNETISEVHVGKYFLGIFTTAFQLCFSIWRYGAPGNTAKTEIK
jgi:hypothetical protein